MTNYLQQNYRFAVLQLQKCCSAVLDTMGVSVSFTWGITPLLLQKIFICDFVLVWKLYHICEILFKLSSQADVLFCPKTLIDEQLTHFLLMQNCASQFSLRGVQIAFFKSPSFWADPCQPSFFFKSFTYFLYLPPK